ncbi:Rhodanese-like protein [Lenzites betulinus]|nr:Rhodanese-like protein [Lenzites betulinus]
MLAQTFARRSLSITRKFTLRSYTTRFGDPVMFGNHSPLVITPTQLLEIKAKDPSSSDLVVLDASWHMPNSPRKGAEEFLRVHLPSARFIDVDEVATPHPLSLPHMLPDPTTFANACARLGISPNTQVVFYDTHGVFSSPRALYMFRAFGHHRSSILDGGLPGWQAHGGPTEEGAVPTIEKQAAYPPPTLNKDVVKDYEQIVANAQADPAKDPDAFYVLDARAKDRFLGKAPEPRAGLRSGHMPHAVSLPFNAFLETHPVPGDAVVRPGGGDGPYTYTRLRSIQGIISALEEALGPERLREVLQGQRQVVTSCGSGMTAGILWLGLKLLGVERVGLYDESWTGYASRPESTVVQGE